MKRWRPSLTRALIGRQIGLLVLMLLVLGATQLLVLRHVLISSQADSLQDELSVLRPLLHHSLKDPSFAGLVPLLFNRLKAPGVEIVLADPAGFTIANSPTLPYGIAPPLPAPHHYLLWANHIVVGSPIVDPVAGKLGTVWLMSSLAPITGLLWQDATLFGLLSLAVLVAAALVGIVSVERTLVPLNEVTATTEHIAHGEFGRQVDVSRAPAEVARLGEAVNRMSAAVRRALDVERQAQEEMRRFIADASHELRTPLTALSGFLDLWAEGGLTPDESMQSLIAMRRETSRMTRLVQQLLTLSRLEQSAPDAIHPVVADADRVVRDLSPTLTALAPERVTVQVGAHTTIWADPDRLAEVLLNLVDNARQYGQGPIRIASMPGPLGVRLTVEDEGPGIAPDVLPHLFDRFYRADPSRSRQAGGAGLGLAIVKSLVEAHGGRVSAENRPEGGARFVVDWPDQPPALAPRPA